MDLPQVVDVSKITEGVTLVLAITPQLEAFNGHFKNAPIVPGVVQIDWVIRFAKLYLDELESFEVVEMQSLKFQQVIEPDLLLSLALKIAKGKLLFSFTSKGGSTKTRSETVSDNQSRSPINTTVVRKHSSGKLVLV